MMQHHNYSLTELENRFGVTFTNHFTGVFGTLFTGYIWDTFKLADGSTVWWKFFLVPAVLCTVMAFVFLLFFKDDHQATEAELKSV